MKILFRVQETNTGEMQRAETLLYAHLKANGIEGRFCQVFESLEFGRLALTGLPALELNG